MGRWMDGWMDGVNRLDGMDGCAPPTSSSACWSASRSSSCTDGGSCTPAIAERLDVGTIRRIACGSMRIQTQVPFETLKTRCRARCRNDGSTSSNWEGEEHGYISSLITMPGDGLGRTKQDDCGGPSTNRKNNLREVARQHCNPLRIDHQLLRLTAPRVHTRAHMRIYTQTLIAR